MSNDDNNKLSTIQAHELDYKRRLERAEFTRGLSIDELLQKINSPQSSSHRSNILHNPPVVNIARNSKPGDRAELNA